MCPKRPINEILCIYGDGIFNSSLKDGTDLIAALLADIFHLLSSNTSVWKKGFKTKFGVIEDCLRRMVYSYSENEYDEAFNEAKALLNGDVDALEYLKLVDDDKEMFARYLVKNVPGNLDRQGSAPAEQNHASYVSQIGPRSVESVTVGIKELLKRQERRNTDLNEKLAQYSIKCRGIRATWERELTHKYKMENKYEYKALFDAICKLSEWGFTKYQDFVNQSLRLRCATTETAHVITKTENDENPTIIPFGERCICGGNKANVSFQCKHEVCRDRGFRIELFDKFWLQLDAVQHSYSEISNQATELQPTPAQSTRSGDGVSSTSVSNVEPERLIADATTSSETLSTQQDVTEESSPISNDSNCDETRNNSSSLIEEPTSDAQMDGNDSDDDTMAFAFPNEDSDSECQPPEPKSKISGTHRKNYSVLKSLSDEIIDSVSFDKTKSEEVAGIFSYVLDAIKNDTLKNATKEDSLNRYMSRFTVQRQNEQNQFSINASPVPRTVARLPGNATGRLKSTSEIHRSRQKSSKSRKQASPEPRTQLSQESVASIPVKGKRTNKRSCQFCGSQEHAKWSVCKVEGKAARLNANIVTESKTAYRQFSIEVFTPNHFVEHLSQEPIRHNS